MILEDFESINTSLKNGTVMHPFHFPYSIDRVRRI
jgi:hypothetical protein